MEKEVFFEKLIGYINNDSVSERKRIKCDIIKDLHFFVERYVALHRKFNSLLWLNYNHVIQDVDLKGENILIITSDHNVYEIPQSFFLDANEIDLTRRLIKEDIERTNEEIDRQYYLINYAHNLINEKTERIKNYEKILKEINKEVCV